MTVLILTIAVLKKIKKTKKMKMIQIKNENMLESKEGNTREFAKKERKVRKC